MENKVLNNEILERYENLSNKGKSIFLNSIADLIEKVEKKDIQLTNKEICETEGHLYGNWKNSNWTTKSIILNSKPIEYIDVIHNKSQRICSRCGHIECIENIEENVLIKKA